MLLIINIIIGGILITGISMLKKYRESAQAKLFCSAFYLIQILECIFTHTIRIYTNGLIFSLIIILVLPFVIFFAYYVIKEVLKAKENEGEK